MGPGDHAEYAEALEWADDIVERMGVEQGVHAIKRELLRFNRPKPEFLDMFTSKAAADAYRRGLLAALAQHDPAPFDG